MTKLIKYLSLTILLLAVSKVYAETTNCTAITSVPYKITAPGVYCLTGNLSLGRVTGRAILINADDVVLDLNGWTLEGTGGSATETVGIKAYKRKNITIRNGTIRGFYYGILLKDLSPYTTSQGHLVEDIHADKNTFIGIIIHGRGNTARRNQVLDTGGSAIRSNAYGIALVGSGGRVLDNDITGTVATSDSEAIGLFIYLADDAVMEGNRIADVSHDTGAAFGIFITTSSDVLARANSISNTGIATFIYNCNDVLVRGNSITRADVGVFYSPDDSGSTGKYMDNLTSNIAVPFVGGTAVGIND